MKRQTPRATGPADDHAEGFIRTLLAGPNGRLSQAFENAWTSPHTSRVEANTERGVTRFLVDRSLPHASGRYELFSIRDQIRVVIEDLQNTGPRLERAPGENLISFRIQLAGEFIAGIGGHVFTFQRLAALIGADTPTYGFRAIGGESGEVPKESVEDIATAYLKELDDRGLAHKPIVLCGYSFGGYVAYEMALRLQLRGVRPEMLVFFDVLAPGYPRRLPVTERALLHAQEFLQRDGGQRRAYIEERFDNLRRRLYFKIGRAESLAGAEDVGVGVFDKARQQEMRALWGATALAQVQYRPLTTTTTPALLLKASVNFSWPATRFDDPAHGWRDWVSGDIAVVPVEGAHLKLFEGDNPARMATAIRRALSTS